MKYYTTIQDINKLMRLQEGRRLWGKTIERLKERGWVDSNKQLTEAGKRAIELQNQPISEPLEKYFPKKLKKY